MVIKQLVETKVFAISGIGISEAFIIKITNRV